MAVAAQFLYVAAQTGVFSFFINYVVSDMPGLGAWAAGLLAQRMDLPEGRGLPDHRARGVPVALLRWIRLFLLGRFTGSLALSWFKAEKTLALFAAVNVLVMGLVMAPLGWISVGALFASFFFMSIMFPTIFALGIKGLGRRPRRPSAFIVMAIVGGAIMPMLMAGWLTWHPCASPLWFPCSVSPGSLPTAEAGNAWWPIDRRSSCDWTRVMKLHASLVIAPWRLRQARLPSPDRGRLQDFRIHRPTCWASLSPEEPLALWYRRPAVEWEEALPVGNGRLGAMVFGGITQEHITLNEDTLWSGGPYDPTNPDALAALPKVRELIFAGKYREAHQLAEAKMMARPLWQAAYQPVGSLLLTFPETAAVQDYRANLTWTPPSRRVSYQVSGVHFVREVFASPVDQVTSWCG